MFGSEIVAKLIDQELRALPELAGFSIVGLGKVPEDMPLPAAIFEPQSSTYSEPLEGFTPQGGGGFDFETLGYAIGVMCDGEDSDPIRPAAYAQLNHFRAAELAIDDDGVTYSVTFQAAGEYLPTTIDDGVNIWRRLGAVYQVQVTRG